MRILAHLSEDQALIKALQSNDVHTETAAKIFHQQLEIPRKEAKTFIERYFEAYPGVEEYQRKTIEEARSKGYVITILGRRRSLPDHGARRRMAERMAINTPVQGSAAALLLQIHDELIVEAPEEKVQEISIAMADIMENAFPLRVPLLVNIATGRTWYEAK